VSIYFTKPSKKEDFVATRIKLREQVEELNLSTTSFEIQAKKIFKEAQRAAALIPSLEFEDVFKAAPEMEYHHRYIQSLLTWVWFEINENQVALENLPDAIQGFYSRYEEPFSLYWL
jgi:hypothetical protein